MGLSHRGVKCLLELAWYEALIGMELVVRCVAREELEQQKSNTRRVLIVYLFPKHRLEGRESWYDS